MYVLAYLERIGVCILSKTDYALVLLMPKVTETHTPLSKAASIE
jgi:hypothetical protein